MMDNLGTTASKRQHIRCVGGKTREAKLRYFGNVQRNSEYISRTMLRMAQSQTKTGYVDVGNRYDAEDMWEIEENG